MIVKKGRDWSKWFKLTIGLVMLSIIFSQGGITQSVEAAGGAYSINFKAGDTDEYIPDIPYPGPGDPPIANTVPVVLGREDGNRYMDPDADFKGDPSLEPSDMAMCQIVPYFFYITVDGPTDPEGGSIIMEATWGTQTKSGSEFGFNKDIMVYSAFVDYTDPATMEVGDPANVLLLEEYWIDSKGNVVTVEGEDVAFHALLQVDGLDDGDAVVVEVWTVLDCASRDGGTVTGNIHVALDKAYTNYTPAETIPTGNQTNPIVQAGDFQPAPVNLNIIKYDDDMAKALNTGSVPFYSDPWMNTIVVSAVSEGDITIDYVANQVVVTDILDPWVELLSDQPYDAINNESGYTITLPGYRSCSWMDDDTDGLGGTLTCELNAVAEGEVVEITYWVRAVSGVPIGSVCEGIPELAPATSVADECLPTYLSPQGYDVMNRADLTTVSYDMTTDDNWDEEPKDIVYPTSVDLESFTATGLFKSVLIEWTTVNESDLVGFNLYRATSEDGTRVKVNDELIRADIFGVESYVYLDLGPRQGLRPNQSYFYWLEDVDFSGYTYLHGPVEATASPHKIK
jgi:hypothetical protein